MLITPSCFRSLARTFFRRTLDGERAIPLANLAGLRRSSINGERRKRLSVHLVLARASFNSRCFPVIRSRGTRDNKGERDSSDAKVGLILNNERILNSA